MPREDGARRLNIDAAPFHVCARSPAVKPLAMMLVVSPSSVLEESSTEPKPKDIPTRVVVAASWRCRALESEGNAGRRLDSLDRCEELIKSYNPKRTTLEAHALEFLGSMAATPDGAFVREVLYGVMRCKARRSGVCFERDRGCFLFRGGGERRRRRCVVQKDTHTIRPALSLEERKTKRSAASYLASRVCFSVSPFVESRAVFV